MDTTVTRENVMHAHWGTDLEALVERILTTCGDHGLRMWIGPLVFPAASALWHDPDDPEGFLDTARDLGVPLVYLHHLTVQDLDPQRDAPGDLDPDALAEVTAGWILDGVLHHLTVTSLAVETEHAVHRFNADLEREELDAELDRLARQVVEDPAFHDHGSAGREDRQRQVVLAAFPDLDDHMALRVARRAGDIDTREYQPDREAEWAREAHELVAQGSTKVDAATHFGISVNVLNRIMQQNPPG